MSPQKKMKPSDYPIFGFRLSKEKKAELEELLAKVDAKLNGKLGKDEKRTPKNEILFGVLQVGLSRLLKK